MRFNLHTRSNICECLRLCVLDPYYKAAVRFLCVFDQNKMPVYMLSKHRSKLTDLTYAHFSLSTRSSLYKYPLLRVSTLSNLILSRSSLYTRRICCFNSINLRDSGAKGPGLLILRCESHPPLCAGLVWTFDFLADVIKFRGWTGD